MSLDNELLIEKAWLSYRDQVIPKRANPTQVIESRRAFYAGAHSLFQTITNILDPGAEPTDADLQTMSSIDAELKRFNGQVKAGIK